MKAVAQKYQASMRWIALVFAGGACASEPRPPKAAVVYQPLTSTRAHEPLEPLPLVFVNRPDIVALGDRLFHDTRLSGDGTISCASCHVIADGGADGMERSIGIDGAEGGINAPTVLNSGLNMVQFWDGRAPTLEEQAKWPVEHPREMGAKWDRVVQRVAADDDYRRNFAEAFDEGITGDSIRTALSAFQRTLLTPASPFDRWLLGDDSALSKQALQGYQLFKSVGCVTCHQGRNVGGNMYQKFGVIGNYFEDRGDLTDADRGRFNVTGREADKGVFRVPSLRNVARTGPYFHDGSAATVEDVVNVMAYYQLGRLLEADEVSKIVAFLESLSGVVPTSKHASLNAASATGAL